MSYTLNSQKINLLGKIGKTKNVTLKIVNKNLFFPTALGLVQGGQAKQAKLGKNF